MGPNLTSLLVSELVRGDNRIVDQRRVRDTVGEIQLERYMMKRYMKERFS